MNASNDYELVDFGNGRKLERFGNIVLDRPSPAAEGVAMSRPEAWRKTTVRYDRTHGDQGIWTPKNANLQGWSVSFVLEPQTRLEPAQRRHASTITLQLQLSP